MTAVEMQPEQDEIELCQELLQMTQSLEKGQTRAVHFKTWKRRERIVSVMAARYGEADLRKLEFGILH